MAGSARGESPHTHTHTHTCGNAKRHIAKKGVGSVYPESLQSNCLGPGTAW